MKKGLILTVVMLIGVISLFSQTFALEPPTKQMTQVVTTNPVSFFYGTFNGAYERILSTRGSIYVEALYQIPIIGSDLGEYSFFGGTVGYRYYLYETAPFGFYVSPTIGAYNFSVKVNVLGAESETTTTYLRGGGYVGYQWIHSSGFGVNLFAGAEAMLIRLAGSDLGEASGSMILPVWGLALAYGW